MENSMRNIKVLDFSQALAGPYCTLMLGDAGAEIIKVERPGSGDMSRAWGAEFTPGMNSYFASINRNKKCITVRMDSDEGRAIIHKLAEWADVVVENYRPGVTQKLGIDYDTLSKINPRIVLFLGYSDNYFGDQDFGLTQVDRTFFVKLGYAWVF